MPRSSLKISSCAAEPRCARELEAGSDLDAFHRLDAHHRGREPGIEPVVLRRVRPEAGRDAASANLDDPADRVPIGLGLIDVAHADNGAFDLDPDLPEQCLGHRARGDRDRRLTSARPLQRIPRVGMAELQRPRQVCVAWTRQRDRLRPLPRRLAFGRPRAHPPLPVLVIPVVNDERERRSERASVTEAGEHLDPVLLELLARAAAIALLAPCEIRVDRVPLESEPGGQPAEDPDESRAVRLSRGRELQGHADKPTARRMTSTGAAAPVQSSNAAAPWATSTSSPSITRAPASRAARPVAVSGYGRSTSV